MHNDALAALDGRRVLVTGGARGLGAAFVRALVAAGAQVVFGDVLHDEGRALAASLREQGRAATYLPLDLADPASVEQFAEQGAARLGGVDALINNAAITNSGGKFADDPVSQCRRRFVGRSIDHFGTDARRFAARIFDVDRLEQSTQRSAVRCHCPAAEAEITSQ